jgi:hypothetical protein
LARGRNRDKPRRLWSLKKYTQHGPSRIAILARGVIDFALMQLKSIANYL